MRHNWTATKATGVSPGSGRPHGVDLWQTCIRCGCERGSGPKSTMSGKRVIRRWIVDSNGNRVDSLPKCI